MKKTTKLFFMIILLLTLSIINCYAEELNCNYIVRKGNKGERVKAIQRVLNDKINCNLTVDGSFGELTKKCVIAYQKANNLSQDGIVGPKTCNSLNGTPIKETTSVIKEYQETSKIYAITLSTKVNIREKASTKSDIIGNVKLGEVVEIYEQYNNWYYVYANNKYGYIRSDLISTNCIVVDISDQTFYYYEDGSLKWSTQVVTGNKGKHDTPIGSYTLNKSNYSTAVYLRGYNDDGSKYKSYVDYWMPFIVKRGIGFHDASWRQAWEFNTTRYQGHGSHGCVNMQHEAAEKLYNEKKEKMDVVIRD